KPLSYIKYGRDNQPNVESKDGNHINVKEYHRDKGRFANVFDNYFMLLDFPSLQVNGNNEELGGVRPSPIVG
uniref:hypothetical protein n=1 Tax=Borreliella garinii TaxID=29519 RepID=UPI001AED5E02